MSVWYSSSSDGVKFDPTEVPGKFWGPTVGCMRLLATEVIRGGELLLMNEVPMYCSFLAYRGNSLMRNTPH